MTRRIIRIANLLIFVAVFFYSNVSRAAVCDVDADVDIDRNDISLIALARNTPADGADDPRDADGDGVISVNDARQCVLQCTLAHCAIVDSDDVDHDSDGFTENQGDCNDTNAAINPGAIDIPGNGIDENCDGQDAADPLNIDDDLDGFTENQGDCDDTNAAINPGAIDIPGNGIDENCDGIDAPIALIPDINTVPSIEFGRVDEGATISKVLTVNNVGTATLVVDSISTDNSVFSVAPAAGNTLPMSIEPGKSANLIVSFTPSPGSGSDKTAFTGEVIINSNDPDEATYFVNLSGNAVEAEPPQSNPIVGAEVDDIISTVNCSNVTGIAEFISSSSSSDTFVVRLTDSGNVTASSGVFTSSDGAGSVNFNGIDACGLADGVLEVSVVLTQGGVALSPFIGTPAVKNTSTLQPPVLDSLPAITSDDVIEVCGSSRENTIVSIEGAAIPVSIQLDASTTRFCVEVSLRQNTQNLLIASAIDNIAPQPKPIAYAKPVSVIHLDPDELIIVDVFSRLLTAAEVADLINGNVINLDNPDNFNVSLFTVVLTIGGSPVTVSQPVPVPKSPGVGYGGGGSGGWFSSFGGGNGSGGGGGGTGGGVCTSSCGQIFVVNPGDGSSGGQVIPGVIIIDGRIKTLKEFFQITIALFNTSDAFVLSEVQANIALPAGLSPVRAGPGSDVTAINVSSEINHVDIGDVGANSTGIGQFIIRGDARGEYNVRVDFSGFITEGGLSEIVPFSGTASTSLEVKGLPELDVVVRHPSNLSGPDVTLNEIYDLMVEITNRSGRPALFTSVDLFVGGSAQLVDENGKTIPQSNSIRTIGIIPAGKTARLVYRVRSLAEGEIIACQGIAGENITLSVETGPDGTRCQINNMYPAAFVPLPVDMPPTVIGINPLNNQPNVPVTTSIVAAFTPRTRCLFEDSWKNVVTSPIGGSPVNGLEVVSADLVSNGTFYLEELDANGEPLGHIPTELVVEHPPAGGTTIAVLRLGLASPLSQAFLKSSTKYRVTLVGGSNGICNEPGSATMPETFTWVFSTAQDCSITNDLVLESIVPADGAINSPLNQKIMLNFNNRLNPGSFSFSPGNLNASSFGVYQNATESGGDVTDEGIAVAGSGTFSNVNKALVYTPAANLPEDTQIHIRLTNDVRDVCGNGLQTGTSNGVTLSRFQTVPPDTTAPDIPRVNRVPGITLLTEIQLSGVAEPFSKVTVIGGGSDVNTSVPGSGLFSVVVLLNMDANNLFEVRAEDASGNISLSATSDVGGAPLETIQDSTPPTVLEISPADGASGVAVDASVVVTFSENLDPGVVGAVVLMQGDVAVPGTINISGDTLTLIPDSPLNFDDFYNFQMTALGVQDLAGNGFAGVFSSSFSSRVLNNIPVAVINAPTTVVEQDVVNLDGSASHDDDVGDTLTYLWILTPPAGSAAALSDSTTVNSSFTADVVGNYEVQLIVNDSIDDSVPATATVVGNLNTPPIADAGPDQTVFLGNTVALNGGNSSDADGHTLTYQWTLIPPAGSNATNSATSNATNSATNNAALSDPNAQSPTFMAEVQGEYTAELIVNDGLVDSPIDTVTITAIPLNLSCGQLLNGAISAAGEVDSFSFSGNTGDISTLTVGWLTGGGRPRIIVNAPSGVEVLNFLGSSQQALALPESGTYTVRVQADNLVNGNTYALGYECLLPLGPVDGTLANGDVIASGIANSAEVDFYTFTGSTGNVQILTLAWLTGGGRPRAIVYAPSGVIIDNFLGTAQKTLTLPETGVYTIQIQADNLVNGNTYNLGLERLAPLGLIDSVLNCGDRFNAGIALSAEVDYYTFSGTAGDASILTVGWLTGGGRPRIIVNAPSGAEVLNFLGSSQQALALPESGTYTVRVQADNLVNGNTYALGYECLLPLGPVDGTLANGDVIASGIANSAEVDFYTFTGSTGNVQILTLAWLTGGGRPRAIVYAPSGVIIDNFLGTAQKTLTLPETGVYTIQIQADNLVNGNTYNLGLERLAPLGLIDSVLNCGDRFNAGIALSAEVDYYTFSGTAGDASILTVGWLTGGGRPRIIVNAPSGAEVLNFLGSSQQALALPESGTYTVRVQADNLVNGNTYALGYECLLPLGPVDGTLANGDVIASGIANSAEVDFYTFTGSTGNVQILTLAWLTGGGRPRAIVYAPSGVIIDNFLGTAQKTLTLPETGVYTIQIQADNLVNGNTYNIGLEVEVP